MAVSGILRWGIILAGSALAAGGMVLMTPLMTPLSPCATKPVAELVDLYPELDTLVQRQRAETERLLARHRAQDVIINMQMSSNKITPEVALRLSQGQVDELAALRRRQEDDFQALCRSLSVRAD